MDTTTIVQSSITTVSEPEISDEEKKADSQSRSDFGRLLSSMFKIGLIGFGGGTALIPVIEEEVVQEQKLVSKQDYDEDVVSACVTPGALPVEIAAGIGNHSYGVRGMLLCALLMALPGALLTVVLLSVLSGSSAAVLTGIQKLSIGLGAFICSLLAVYVVKAVKEAKSESTRHAVLTILITTAVFALSAEKNLYAILGLDLAPVFNLSTIEVLGLAFYLIIFNGCTFRKERAAVSAAVTVIYFGCVCSSPVFPSESFHLVVFLLMAAMAAAAAVVDVCTQNGTVSNVKKAVHSDSSAAALHENTTNIDGKRLLLETLVWIAFAVIFSIPALLYAGGNFSYMLRGFASSLISFGGGDAYLSVADGMFVSTGFVDSTSFYSTLVPVANVLPGSILCKILSGVGYLYGLEITGSSAGGFAFALSGLSVSVSASGMVFGIIRWIFKSFENVSIFRQISKWIRPIISGLLLNVLITMFRANLSTGVQLGVSAFPIWVVTAGLLAVNLYLLLAKKKSSFPVMLFSAAAGLACMAVL